MTGNKVKLILVLCVSIFIVFSLVVILLFNYVSNNTIDNISIAFIYGNSADIEREYGEIIYIGKNITHKTKKTNQR